MTEQQIDIPDYAQSMRIAAETHAADMVEREERQFLLVLARYQLRNPNASVSDDLKLHSTLDDEDEREQAFDWLCSTIADRMPAAFVEAALDSLRGGAS